MSPSPSEPSGDQPQANLESDSDPTASKNDDVADGEEDGKWWENESQFLLNSQQLVEGLSLCDELLQSQSPCRGENVNSNLGSNRKPLLSDYMHLGADDLKRDLEACQDSPCDIANIDLDTQPDFRLSQLEFESQDSYIAWGGSVRGGGKVND